MRKALATKSIAAVLLSLTMVFGFAYAFATPEKGDEATPAIQTSNPCAV